MYSLMEYALVFSSSSRYYNCSLLVFSVCVCVAFVLLHSSFARTNTYDIALIPNYYYLFVLEINHFGKFGAYFVYLREKEIER